MRIIPDPQQHFEQHIKRAVEQYVDGLDKAGLQPNDTLTRAVAERAVEEARESYIQQATAIHTENIQDILRTHNSRLNQIKRDGARLRLLTCPPIALFFGLIAWYCFANGNLIASGIQAAGALSFLAMLVLGAIFDRPRRS